MNYYAILNKINKYVDTVNPDELIKSLERKGYEFEDLFLAESDIEKYVIFHPIDIGGTNGTYRASVNNERASNTSSFFLS